MEYNNKKCVFCKFKENNYICQTCNGGVNFEEMQNAYETIYNKFSNKWQFNNGLRGVIGSYNLVKSNGKYKLNLWVSDKRCTDKRNIKEIFSTYNVVEMHDYLQNNNPK